MQQAWILSMAAMLCTAGCISNGGSENSTIATGSLATSEFEQTPTPSETSTADWWSTSWKTNPLTRWMNKDKIFPTSLETPAEQEAIVPKMDPISLDYASKPENAKLYMAMAKVSDKSGNPQQARVFYQKALKLEPDNLSALLAMARFEDRQGSLDEAIQHYQKAITAHPKNTTALNDLAICYARKNRLPVALELLEQAVELQPEKPIYRNNIAKILTELNQQEASLAHLSAVHPPAVAHYNQGILLIQRGRNEEAINYLTQATTIDPKMQPAHLLLAKLHPENPLQVASRTGYPASGVSARIPLSEPSQQSQSRYTQPSTHLVPGSNSHLPVGDAPLVLPPVR